jgi:hypothetical protein
MTKYEKHIKGVREGDCPYKCIQILYMSDVNSSNNVLPVEKVSSTGGNTALYECAYKGGAAKKKTGKRRVKKSFLTSIKKFFKIPIVRRRKTAKR